MAEGAVAINSGHSGYKSLDPAKVKVLITTRWSGTSYKSATIRRVESYSIETAIDSDADPWAITIGNPTGDLNAILARDNEVRVQIYGAGDRKTYLLTGIMDDANFDQEGSVTLSGRDLSSIAVDSDHFPDVFRKISARDLIQKEAKEIGVTTKFKMQPTGGPKTWLTDGSEKYWEFWYRMIRKEKQWMWLEPDGTLVAGELNYAASPKYKFATANVAKSDEILIESFSFRKTTQNRFGKIAVAWRSQKGTSAGQTPTISIFEDPTTSAWRKRPQKIIEDRHATNLATAKKVSDEEIHESKVGALEIVINVPDPGFIIEQNNMCRLRIPGYGISGEWFIVGTTISGDSGGFMQSVRLREKNFAVSDRVPDDPEWDKNTSGANDPAASGWPSNCAGRKMGEHPEWWACFVDAAEKWRGSFSLDLFLATLLAIAEHETNFQNIRSNNQADGSGHEMPAPGEHGVEWTDIRNSKPTPSELEKWKINFANEGGDGYLTWDCAVGPMQLFSDSLKQAADSLHDGKINEFFGNRWNPCDNIMIAAKKLHDSIPYQNGSEGNLWAGVCAYGGWDAGCAYGEWVKNAVKKTDEGWLGCVQEALTTPTPSPSEGPLSDFYVAPFSPTAVIPQRTDQGVDYSAPFGTPIVTMGRCKICEIADGPTPTSTWPPWISYELLDGPNAGAIIFVAENINFRAGIKIGDVLKPGTQIAIFTGGIETGYAASCSSDHSPCTRYNGAPDGTPMPGGKAFARFLMKLGVPVQQDPGPGGWKSPCI